MNFWTEKKNVMTKQNFALIKMEQKENKCVLSVGKSFFFLFFYQIKTYSQGVPKIKSLIFPFKIR